MAGALVPLKVLQDDGRARLSVVDAGGGRIEPAGMPRVAETVETASARPAGDDG